MLGARPRWSFQDYRAPVLLRLSYVAISPYGARLAAVLAGVAITALLVLAMTGITGLTEVSETQEPYEQRADFSYAADGAPGIYDQAGAVTGDPVFRQLADRVELRFRYEFQSRRPATVHGSYRVDARISQGNGWHRTLPLVAATEFSGPRFQVESVLDLAMMQRLIETLEQQSGVESRSYLVSLALHVGVQAVIDGRLVAESFVPEQRFLLGPQVLQPQPPDGSQELSFTPVGRGHVPIAREQARSVGLLGLRATTRALRAAATLALTSTGLPLLGWLALSAIARRGDEVAAINAEYQDVLVHGRIEQLPESDTIVAVWSIAQLVRIAQLQGVAVLAEQPSVHGACYFVLSSRRATYYYRPSAGEAAGEQSLPERCLVRGGLTRGLREGLLTPRDLLAPAREAVHHGDTR